MFDEIWRCSVNNLARINNYYERNAKPSHTYRRYQLERIDCTPNPSHNGEYGNKCVDMLCPVGVCAKHNRWPKNNMRRTTINACKQEILDYGGHGIDDDQ